MVSSVTLTWRGTSVLRLRAPGPYTTSVQATLGPGVSTWAPLCICYPALLLVPWEKLILFTSGFKVLSEYRRKMPTENKQGKDEFHLWRLRLAFTRTHILENVLELFVLLFTTVLQSRYHYSFVWNHRHLKDYSKTAQVTCIHITPCQFLTLSHGDLKNSTSTRKHESGWDLLETAARKTVKSKTKLQVKNPNRKKLWLLSRWQELPKTPLSSQGC